MEQLLKRFLVAIKGGDYFSLPVEIAREEMVFLLENAISAFPYPKQNLLEFDRDRLGKSLVVYGESLIHQIDEYRMQCDKIITFLKIHGYDKIKGIFSLQFLHTSENSSEWYLHDFNSRTGPFTVELQLSGLIDPRIYRMMKCMVGDMPLSGINENAQRFRHYTEDNGKILSSLNIIPSPERLMLRANKRSGMIRNDYQVFIERIEQ